MEEQGVVCVSGGIGLRLIEIFFFLLLLFFACNLHLWAFLLAFGMRRGALRCVAFA